MRGFANLLVHTFRCRSQHVVPRCCLSTPGVGDVANMVATHDSEQHVKGIVHVNAACSCRVHGGMMDDLFAVRVQVDSP